MFCDDDIVAAGLYLAARERGLRIPRDLSVIGFDDMDFARVLDPALTTVALDAELLGATAFELLEQRMAGGRRAAADRAPRRARRARLDRAAAVSDVGARRLPGPRRGLRRRAPAPAARASTPSTRPRSTRWACASARCGACSTSAPAPGLLAGAVAPRPPGGAS